MMAVIVGLVFFVGGLWGMLHWFPAFLVFLKGMIPVSLFIGGIVAIIAGFSGIQDRFKDDAKKK